SGWNKPWEWLGRSCFPQERCEYGPILRWGEVATPGDQTADAHGMLRHQVATHRARALLAPPADGALTSTGSSIQRPSWRSFPSPRTAHAMPEIPAIQKPESQTRGYTL